MRERVKSGSMAAGDHPTSAPRAICGRLLGVIPVSCYCRAPKPMAKGDLAKDEFVVADQFLHALQALQKEVVFEGDTFHGA